MQLEKFLLFFLVLISLFFVPTIKASPHQGELRLLSYNVWGMPFPIRPSHKNLRAAPAIIPALGADIIAMQEVFIKRAKDLGNMKGYPYAAWGAKAKGLFKFLDSGLLLLSKYPILEVDTITYDSCRGSDCLASKGAMYARISIPGYGEVDVFNTHLNAGKNKKTKRRQLQELLTFVNSKRSWRPLLIMGDFNLEPDSEFYQSFAQTFDVHDSHREYLKKFPEVPKEEVEGFTYMLNLGLIYIRQKLDYIWYQPGDLQDLYLQDYKVVYDGKNGLPKLSDHFGLTALFHY